MAWTTLIFQLEMGVMRNFIYANQSFVGQMPSLYSMIPACPKAS
tara:strand:+ start:2409 stop:2540 length:132 start_codon:yes stop_codon:yes gene_type:complete